MGCGPPVRLDVRNPTSVSFCPLRDSASRAQQARPTCAQRRRSRVIVEENDHFPRQPKLSEGKVDHLTHVSGQHLAGSGRFRSESGHFPPRCATFRKQSGSRNPLLFPSAKLSSGILYQSSLRTPPNPIAAVSAPLPTLRSRGSARGEVREGFGKLEKWPLLGR